MDKSCQPSGETTSTSSTASGKDHNCLSLSKLSHKIAKSTSFRKPSFDAPLNQNHQTLNQIQSASPPVQAQQQQQHQPPVYNINKNDFRDVVQKLTGSPAHERLSNPPPIHPPKPQSSRLHRIRPPPLAHVSYRPPPQQLSQANPNNFNSSTAATFGLTGRAASSLSPLPPLPPVYVAAESPVSAYMRYFHNSTSTAVSNPQTHTGVVPLGPQVSSSWNNFNSQQQAVVPPPPPSNANLQTHTQFQIPSSPLAFGCLNSPKSASAYTAFSSSTSQLGFPQLPLSPTVPVSSPRWRGD